MHEPTGGICIVACEPSGDAHGALLIAFLKKYALKKNILPSEKERWSSSKFFWGLGGDLMAEEGFFSLYPINNLAVMGISEILDHYQDISKAYQKILLAIERGQPHAVIFIDYPGFNMRLLQQVHAMGIKTIYHIPPKAWSHGEDRTKILRKNANLVTCIFPFETIFFKSRDVICEYVGNPLRDKVISYIQKHPEKTKSYLFSEENPPKIGLLPGSRPREIQSLLPLLVRSFLELKITYKKAKAYIPVAPGLDISLVSQIIRSTCQEWSFKNFQSKNKSCENVINSFEFGKELHPYKVFSISHYAWVCSGTAALEGAFFQTPMSTLYKVAPFTAFLARKLLKVKYVSLVNLSLNTLTIPEFLQEQAVERNLVSHAQLILANEHERLSMEEKMLEIKNLYPPHAGENLAHLIFDYLYNKTNS